MDKNKEVMKLYKIILKDIPTFEMLRKELGRKSQLGKNFIKEKLLPITQKNNLNISWKDILDYEKNNLITSKTLTLNDLENVSGGRTLNSTLSCSLLALLGFSGFTNNVASTKFIPFTQTKEFKEYSESKNTKLGEIPFYLQADRMIDGILWFKHPTKDLAFFILDRKISSTQGEPTEDYTCKNYKDLQKHEYKLLDVNKLPKDLKDNFEKAKEESVTTNSSIQLAEDNPLFNFSRFYNKNYTFKKGSNRENLSEIPMYADSNFDDDSFKRIDWDEKISNDETIREYAKRLEKKLKETISWKIAHRLKSDEQPPFKTIESSQTINNYYKKASAHTGDIDKNKLRNDGFTFFTLQAIESKPAIPQNLFSPGDTIQEAILDFTDIPLVSCSKDMLPILDPETNVFFKKGDPLPEKFPCFNGSSEEVKDQLVKYYVNQKLTDIKKEDCSESNMDSFIKEIIEQINYDCLEVRIPTKVRVNDWKSFKNEDSF